MENHKIWRLGFNDGRVACVNEGDRSVCECDSETPWEDARRIIACVNACAGIATEKLEQIAGEASQADRMKTLSVAAMSAAKL